MQLRLCVLLRVYVKLRVCASESLYGDTGWVVVILLMWVEIWR